MKMTDVLLLLALALCCIPDIDAQQDLCRDQAVPVKDCTLEYTPICGSDGRTYMNKCFFCNEVLETRGRLRFAHFGNC